MRPAEQRSRTAWLTAAFWMYLLLFVYMLIGFLVWWSWLMFIGVGVALSYFWWKRRRRSRSSVLFGVTCALCAALALVVAGGAVLDTVFVYVDSIGSRRVDCGSVLKPVAAHELKVTPGESVAGSGRILQSSMERVCSNRLHSRGNGAAGVVLVGLLLAVRATGHFVAPRNYSI